MQEAILLGSTGLDSDPNSLDSQQRTIRSRRPARVYINAYRYRLYDVTAEDYPVLKHYLGDEAYSTRSLQDFVNSVSFRAF